MTAMFLEMWTFFFLPFYLLIKKKVIHTFIQFWPSFVVFGYFSVNLDGLRKLFLFIFVLFYLFI